MRGISFRKALLFAAFLTLLGGCGGGGGSSSEVTQPSTGSNWDQMRWDQDNWA